MFSHDHSADAVPIHLVDEEGLETWRAAQDDASRAWLANCLFRAERGKVVPIPSAAGAFRSVVVGVGKRPADLGIPRETSFWTAAGLPDRLPPGRFRLSATLDTASMAQFAHGWAYGHYRFDRYRKPASERVQLLEVPESIDLAEVRRLHEGCSLARDLVNTPASDMSPADLANAAQTLARKHGASVHIVVGDDLLAENFPAIHAVDAQVLLRLD